MTHPRRLAALLILALANVACEGSDSTAPQLEPAEDALAEALASTASTGGGGLLDRLAAELTGFGGLYRDAICSVNVVLTDGAQADKAVSLVRTGLAQIMGRACPNGVRVTPVRGVYTYTELNRFLAAARPLSQLRGVLGLRVDYQKNGLVVTVLAREVAGTVLEALPRLGIPAGAVHFEAGRSTGSGSGGRTRG